MWVWGGLALCRCHSRQQCGFLSLPALVSLVPLSLLLRFVSVSFLTRLGASTHFLGSFLGVLPFEGHFLPFFFALISLPVPSFAPPRVASRFFCLSLYWLFSCCVYLIDLAVGCRYQFLAFAAFARGGTSLERTEVATARPLTDS